MVKVIYREHGQQVDLAGKSVAEVRELYKSEFSIPDRAKASLNGKQLKRKLEPETKLGDEDKLSFEERSGKGLVLFGAFLLALAITGGLFAYTATTDTITLGVTGVDSDFGSVTENATGLTPSSYAFLGKLRGAIGTGMIFDLTKHANYTGDVEVHVYLANPDELSENYSFWLLRVKLQDINGNWMTTDGKTQVLSLNSPSVVFASDNASAIWPAYVYVEGGAYRAISSSLWSTVYNPLIFCEIVQAGSY